MLEPMLELEALRRENVRLQKFCELTFDYAYTLCVQSDGALRVQWLSGDLTRLANEQPPEAMTHFTLLLGRVYPEDRSVVENSLKRLLDNQSDVVEFRILTLADEVRWLRNYARPVRDSEQGRVVEIIGVAQDITRQRQTEEALWESESLLRQVVDLSPYSLFVKDSQRRYLLLNKAASRIFGISSESLLLKTDVEIAQQFGFSLAEAERAMELDQRVIEHQETLVLSAEPFTLSDGSVRWFQIIKMPLALRYDYHCIVGNMVDVTERMLVEAELRARNEELALLYQVSQTLSASLDLDVVLETVLSEACRVLELPASSIWLLDDETAELVCRQAIGLERDIVRTWRLPPGEGLGGWAVRTGQTLIVADATTDNRHFVDVDRQTGVLMRSIASVPLRSPQRVLGVLQLVDTQPNRFSEGNLAFIEALAATAAITVENARLYAMEQQRVEALAQTLEQQCELDRLKDQFIQNVSHELRTPLTIARGYADLLADGEMGGPLPAPQHEAAQTVSRRLAMLTHLVEDINVLLDVSLRRPRCEPLNLLILVQQSTTDFIPVAQKSGLTLQVDVPDTLPLICAGEVYMQRVLDNLLSNACKFTSSGGAVTLCVFQEGPEVVVQVSDTGIGIPESEFDKIFERFYQVDGSSSRRYGGTGLGLALVKEIINAYQGRVEVSSTLDKGSTFTVYLPLWRET